MNIFFKKWVTLIWPIKCKVIIHLLMILIIQLLIWLLFKNIFLNKSVSNFTVSSVHSEFWEIEFMQREWDRRREGLARKKP